MSRLPFGCARCAAALAAIIVGANAYGDLPPRVIGPKPVRTIVDPIRHDRNVVIVKFVDDFPVEALGGALADRGTGRLAPARDALRLVAAGTWRPMHRLPRPKLEQLRTTAQENLRKQVADLTTSYYLDLPPGLDAGAVCDAFNALDIVEIAVPNPLPAPPPAIPDYEGMQQYLEPATNGVDTDCMWTVAGGTGVHTVVCDIEYSWNLNHDDLPPIVVLSTNPTDPFGDTNHGTAVLGVMAGLDNGMGVTGICYDAAFFVAGAHHSGSYNLPQGITDALGTLGDGDFILIEQQTRGPNFLDDGTQFGLVPSEWDVFVYTAVVTAVGNNVSVIAAAGNSSQDLDGPEYNVGHAPFVPGNESGAIIVGAGAPPGHPDGDRSRLGFSNWGSRVDLQGIGAWVTTTGYGDLYLGAGMDEWMTNSFSGTSSSSPIVTGAAAILQSAYFAAQGFYLTPGQVRQLLVSTGSPQTSGTNPASQNIGPRPNASAAFAMGYPFGDLDANLVPDPCDPDCQPNGVADGFDISSGASQDCNSNNVPDECDIASGFSVDCNLNGVPDDCDLAAGTSQDCNGNLIPDECDIASGFSDDCNVNGVPDDCDIAAGTSQDCQPDGIPDDCQLAMPPADCGNPHPGTGCGSALCESAVCAVDPSCCDTAWDPVCAGIALSLCNNDCNGNGIPDDCETDCNANGVPDDCDTAPEPTAPVLNGAKNACEEALLILTGVEYTGTTAGATQDGPFNHCDGTIALLDVWYRYRPTWSGDADFSWHGSLLAVNVEVWAGCPNDGGVRLLCSTAPDTDVTLEVTRLEDYWIRIAGPGLTTGPFEFSIIGPMTNLNPTDTNVNGIPDECECLADVNGDSLVSYVDLAMVTATFGVAGGPTDVDGSGLVDEADQLFVLAHLGPCPTFPATWNGDPIQRPRRSTDPAKRLSPIFSSP